MPMKGNDMCKENHSHAQMIYTVGRVAPFGSTVNEIPTSTYNLRNNTRQSQYTERRAGATLRAETMARPVNVEYKCLHSIAE
jgi:hypothetical protein